MFSHMGLSENGVLMASYLDGNNWTDSSKQLPPNHWTCSPYSCVQFSSGCLQGAPAATSGPWGNPLGKSMGNERFAHKKVKKNWNIAHEKWKTRLYETNSKSWGNSLKKGATTVKLTIWSGRKNGLKRQQKGTQKKWEFQYRKPGWTKTTSWETMEKLQKNVENEGTRRFN